MISGFVEFTQLAPYLNYPQSRQPTFVVTIHSFRNRDYFPYSKEGEEEESHWQLNFFRVRIEEERGGRMTARSAVLTCCGQKRIDSRRGYGHRKGSLNAAKPILLC